MTDTKFQSAFASLSPGSIWLRLRLRLVLLVPLLSLSLFAGSAQGQSSGQETLKLAVKPERPYFQPDLNLFTTGLTLKVTEGGEQFPIIDNIDRGAPAYSLGLRSGDRLISVNGEIAAFMGFDELRGALTQKNMQVLTLEVEKQDGKTQSYRIPMIQAGQLQDSKIARLLADQRPHYPVARTHISGGFAPIDLPSFLHHEAMEGPLVVEFYQGQADQRLKEAIAALNRQILAGRSSGAETQEQIISLISLSLDDADTRPLRTHFRITRAPSYLFIGTRESFIKDYIDVVRHELSEADLEERLAEASLLHSRKQNMLPMLYPQLAKRWKEITNQEIDRAK
ncbi:MAG TPA: PDZ domain-containing protein [Candidatus Obscuribacter sp.]|nr:PDZ domain-containing protein [Candidatus Obscuribacter sp.]